MQKDWGSHSKATQPSSTPNLLCVEGRTDLVFLTPDLESDAGRARFPQHAHHLCCLTTWPSLLGVFSVYWCPSPQYFSVMILVEYRKLPEAHESHEQKSSDSTAGSAGFGHELRRKGQTHSKGKGDLTQL